MRLDDAALLIRGLMDEHGLIEAGWHARIGKGTRTLGLCSYGKKRITIMGPYISAADAESVRNTVLHEIAHALVRPTKDPWTGRWDKHGHAWRAKCLEIGGDGQRCGDNPFVDQERQARRDARQRQMELAGQALEQFGVGHLGIVELPNSQLHGTVGVVAAMGPKIELEVEGRLIRVPKLFVKPYSR